MNEPTHDDQPRQEPIMTPPPLAAGRDCDAAAGRQDMRKPSIPSQEYATGKGTSRDKSASTFSDDFRPMEAPPTVLNITESLLKRPAQVVHEIIIGRSARAIFALLTVLVLCMLITGFIMGSFSGKEQLLIVPTKVTAGMLLSILICLPSLYVFGSLSGGKLSFAETAGLLLQAGALAGVLLVGFGPIAWLFSQATETSVFMGILHLTFWLIAVRFGMRFLGTAFSQANGQKMVFLKIWSIIFVAVILQMSTTLRPIIGESTGFKLQQKTFFLAHWIDSLRDRAR